MFCKNCGTELKDDAIFCPNCGTKVNGDASAESKPAPAPAKPAVNKKNVWVLFTEVIVKFFKIITTGRASKRQYWSYFLFWAIFSTALELLALPLAFLGLSIVAYWANGLLFVGLLYVGCRRMHDVGKPAGYWFIPIYGDIILCCKDGEKGENKYGADPSEEDIIK